VITDIIPAALANPQVVYKSPQVIGRIPGTTFAWTLHDLSPGESGLIRVRATARTPGTVVNTAQVAAAEPDPQPGSNAASASISVARPMRFGPITVTYQQVQPGRYAVTATSHVLDLAQRPVPGAVATALWTKPGGGLTPQQVTSSAQGRAAFRINTMLTGLFRLCVTGVTKSGWLYDASRNVETCDSVTIP
jgi:hypothetical protein